MFSIEQLNHKLDQLDHKIDIILQRLDEQKPIQTRLDRHITFIESVYSRLKGVVNYLSWFGPKKADSLQNDTPDTHDTAQLV
jgi:hypothetical protein